MLSLLPRLSCPVRDHPRGPSMSCQPSTPAAKGTLCAFISGQNGNSKPVSTWRGHNSSCGRLGNSQKFPHRCAEQAGLCTLGVTQITLKLLFQSCLCIRVSKNSQSSFLPSRRLGSCLYPHHCCTLTRGLQKTCPARWGTGRKPPLIVNRQ